MKIKLLRPKRRSGWQHPDHKYITVKEALPFVRKAHGSYVHRIRSGVLHVHEGRYSHTVFELWCGNPAYYDKGGFFATGRPNLRYNNTEFFAEPPERAIMCATCEGRAIGAGFDGPRAIAGRTVLFAPRV